MNNDNPADEKQRAGFLLSSDHLPLLSIGHSNHSFATFSRMLFQWRIAVVADVRSAPVSRFCPHFNKIRLSRSLEQLGIAYHYLGDRLGGRPKDPDCYEDGAPSYRRIAAMPWFQDGLEALIGLAAGRRVAMMCAERDPAACHRSLLIAPALAERGLTVHHILADGSGEAHADLAERLKAEGRGRQ